MNVKQSHNRVENDLKQFREKEERFVKLFSPGVINKVLVKEKLNYYQTIKARYKDTANQEEKFALRLLDQERRELAKRLYPNPLVRLIVWLSTPLSLNHATQRHIRQTNQNEQALKEVLHKTGFKNAIPKIDGQIKQGQDQFSVPVSYYVNEKERMDFKLSFAKDKNGQYQFESYAATLGSEDEPQEIKKQTFDVAKNDSVTAVQAYNLLAGRCIQKAQNEDRSQKTWMQLDFTDKGASGNYRIKEFNPAYGYDLKHALQQLPIKELQNRDALEKLVKMLREGNREAVTIFQNGSEKKIFIEANPQFKSLNLYDENHNKISVASALGITAKKPLGEVIDLNPKTTQSRKNGLSM